MSDPEAGLAQSIAALRSNLEDALRAHPIDSHRVDQARAALLVALVVASDPVSDIEARFHAPLLAADAPTSRAVQVASQLIRGEMEHAASVLSGWVCEETDERMLGLALSLLAREGANSQDLPWLAEMIPTVAGDAERTAGTALHVLRVCGQSQELQLP